MECDGDYHICGFSMGPAFYGTSSVMIIDTDNLESVSANTFLQPWSGDPTPQAPQSQWGMDTSNVAAINDTHGVAYAWEIWRGAADGSAVNRGNAVASITLGDDKPIATRIGPLLTGPDAVQLGLLAILNAGDGYIYTYSIGGPTNITIGRVSVDDDAVFDPSAYEFLVHSPSNTSPTWTPGIPTSDPTSSIGASTANPSGFFNCNAYGSVFFSTYFKQYVIICGLFESYVNMYVSDTPYGPWSAEYRLLDSEVDQNVGGSYGPMVHREYDTTGDQEVVFSMGPDQAFNVFKVSFEY